CAPPGKRSRETPLGAEGPSVTPTGDDMSGVVGVCTMHDSAGTILCSHAAALWNEMQCCGLLLELTVLLIERETGSCRAIFSISGSVNGLYPTRRASICRADQPPAMTHWRPCATWPIPSAAATCGAGQVGLLKWPMNRAASSAPRSDTPYSSSSRRICSSVAPNNQHRSQHQSGRPRSPLLMRPGPRQQRLFGRSRRDTHTRHNCSRSISDSETSFAPCVERVRGSRLEPGKCFRSLARRAADIDVCDGSNDVNDLQVEFVTIDVFTDRQFGGNP